MANSNSIDYGTAKGEGRRLLPSKDLELQGNGGGVLLQQQDYQSLVFAESSSREMFVPVNDTQAFRPPSLHYKSRNSKSKFQLDKDALHFGIRMAVLITIASLFCLVGDEQDGTQYPQGIWVLISVLFVSWFPSLDAASVVEKSIQRLIGTFLGALLGLFFGFSSLAVLSYFGQEAQTWFIAASIGLVTFISVFLSVQFRVGQAKIIQKFSYASILFLLTFYLCLLPFDIKQEPRWLHSMYRVINVIVGCLIGALGSILILPRSTTSILKERISRQVKLAGESSEAVLHASADAFSGEMMPLSLAAEMLESPGTRRSRMRQSLSRKSFRAVNKDVVDEDGDVALQKYETAIQDWKVTRAVFSIVRYDPFNLISSSETTRAFHTETANTLARALRLQNTVVLLDGIIRNGTKHDFKEVDLILFADIGTLIRRMLTVPLNRTLSDQAAEELLEKLAQTRFRIVQSCSVVGRSSHELPSLDLARSGSGTRLSEMESKGTSGQAMPKHVRGSSVCALLFQQLVEHLALRALGLYRAWKHVEEISM